ncbi:MAG TPA: amidohydrolase family protein [Xanthobacteraceae bacterium]|jgi:predicted TIM-barrel fold metal-dependent hydrolase
MNGIIDAHHHVWRQADLPWLSGPMVPRIFGPYEPLRRDYLIGEYLADAKPNSVTRSVYVQANWPAARALDEIAWVQSVADASGWPHGIVGYVDLLAEDCTPALDAAMKASPLLRGMRMQLHWHENELYRFAPRPDLSDDPKLQKNLARLAERGLLFELQVFTPQMESAARLARSLPNLQFVLMHAGMLEDTSAKGLAEWRAGMDTLAACPNIATKLSGFGTFLHRIDAEYFVLVAGETVRRFGAKRCLFGSNFPIEKLWTDYGTLLGAYQTALVKFTDADRTQIFSETARRIYRLK